ncbi:MAG: beta-ketoacyl-ACP synthase [Pseudomonadota bacterium]
MSASSNPVWITGIGLLSCLGEGVEAHWQGLNDGAVHVDTERFAPYPVHALGEVDWASQISRRDMRQMEGWQRIGTYAAGLALDDAGAKGDEDLCGRMDMIVAAGGGERDAEVDSTIMAQARASEMEKSRTASTNDHDALLNERLSNDLRPTLFLAQLSNLLAGNISIVHKVTGSSRTFMGEEGAGISAIKTAHARIASGQSDIVLVGGGFNGEREDMLLLFELGHFLARGDHAPVWSRNGEQAGFAQGSIGAFLILESAEHAKARGAKPYAALAGVDADAGHRDGTKLPERLTLMKTALGADKPDAIFSAATGVAEPTIAEKDWLNATYPQAPIRAVGTKMGHGVEAQFPLAIALAALSVAKGEVFNDAEEAEIAATTPIQSALATSIGHLRGEGLGFVTRVETDETRSS